MIDENLLKKLIWRISEPGYYAGIGSQETPKTIQAFMAVIARYLAAKGMHLRSGGAAGADDAFASGTDVATIWRPAGVYRPTVQKNLSHTYRYVDYEDMEAWRSVERFHPTPNALKAHAYALMARNYRQIVGEAGYADSRFVVCWTRNGSLDGSERDSGGTGQALRIAVDRAVPVYNLKLEAHLKIWVQLIYGECPPPQLSQSVIPSV
jgi:hypothetical protein